MARAVDDNAVSAAAPPYSPEGGRVSPSASWHAAGQEADLLGDAQQLSLHGGTLGEMV
jgi:hypothetical protein